MKSMLRVLVLGAGVMLALGSLSGCSALSESAKTVYTAGAKGVKDYCALPEATRAVGQLVLVGKVYNSGLCDVVHGDVDIAEQLAEATGAQINKLIEARVKTALDTGKIDQATADMILAGSKPVSPAAVEAVAITSVAPQSDQAAVVLATASNDVSAQAVGALK